MDGPAIIELMIIKKIDPAERVDPVDYVKVNCDVVQLVENNDGVPFIDTDIDTVLLENYT